MQMNKLLPQNLQINLYEKCKYETFAGLIIHCSFPFIVSRTFEEAKKNSILILLLIFINHKLLNFHI